MRGAPGTDPQGVSLGKWHARLLPRSLAQTLPSTPHACLTVSSHADQTRRHMKLLPAMGRGKNGISPSLLTLLTHMRPQHSHTASATPSPKSLALPPLQIAAPPLSAARQRGCKASRKSPSALLSNARERSPISHRLPASQSIGESLWYTGSRSHHVPCPTTPTHSPTHPPPVFGSAPFRPHYRCGSSAGKASYGISFLGRRREGIVAMQHVKGEFVDRSEGWIIRWNQVFASKQRAELRAGGNAGRGRGCSYNAPGRPSRYLSVGPGVNAIKDSGRGQVPPSALVLPATSSKCWRLVGCWSSFGSRSSV